MSKDYKGYELIKEITEGNIKEDTEIEVHSLKVLDIVVAYIKYKNKRLNWEEGKFNTSYLVDTDYYFRIVEEQEEIDIQELEEIKEMEVFLSIDTRQTLEENLKKIDKHEVNFFFKINEIIRKQNKIVQYLEQLDKNIKEK